MGTRHSIILAAVAFSTMAGCAQLTDDPDNPPQLGRWGMMLEFASASVEGNGARREDFQDMTGSATLSRLFSTSGPNCTEPSLQTPDYVIDMFSREFGDCSALPDSQPGALAIRCVDGPETSDLRFTGTLGDASGEGTVSVDVSGGEGGNIRPGTVRASIAWTRHGDCR